MGAGISDNNTSNSIISNITDDNISVDVDFLTLVYMMVMFPWVT